jgi:hypothetical protein
MSSSLPISILILLYATEDLRNKSFKEERERIFCSTRYSSMSSREWRGV